MANSLGGSGLILDLQQDVKVPNEFDAGGYWVQLVSHLKPELRQGGFFSRDPIVKLSNCLGETMSIHNICVAPAHLGWTIRAEDNAAVGKSFGSLNEAIEAATDIAKLERAELVVYGLDGRLRLRRSFCERTSEATSFSR